MLEITIKGDANEIADLVLELQNRQQNNTDIEILSKNLQDRSRELFMAIENQLPSNDRSSENVESSEKGMCIVGENHFVVQKAKVWVIFPDDMPMTAKLNVAICPECGHMAKLIFKPRYCSGCGKEIPKSVLETPAF